MLTPTAPIPIPKIRIFIRNMTLFIFGFVSFFIPSSISIERNFLVLIHATIIAKPTVTTNMTAVEIIEIRNFKSN